MPESEKQRQDLISRIERVRQPAVDQMVDVMYQDPFWDARFGEKGRKHARLDGDYHIKQLITAIALDMPSLTVNYYHWLQGLLIYRGMNTLHIQETIDCLASQFLRLLPDDWARIEPYLCAGAAGLAYEHPVAQELACQAYSIATAMTDRLYTPERIIGQKGQAVRQSYLREIRHQLSYLCDSAGLYEAAFEKHILWLGGYLFDTGESVLDLYQNLKQISQEIASALPAEVASPFEKIIQRTLQQSFFAPFQNNRSLQ